jgi:hypothetical protein
MGARLGGFSLLTGTRRVLRQARRAFLLLTLVGGVVVLAGAPPAAAVTCPVAPVAVNQSYSVPFGEQLKVAAPGLLSGATGTGIAVETSWQTGVAPSFPSDDLSASGAVIEYGTAVALSRLGGFTYTPDPNLDPFSGIDNFLFTVTNPCGDEAYG